MKERCLICLVASVKWEVEGLGHGSMNTRKACFVSGAESDNGQDTKG